MRCDKKSSNIFMCIHILHGVMQMKNIFSSLILFTLSITNAMAAAICLSGEGAYYFVAPCAHDGYRTSYMYFHVSGSQIGWWGGSEAYSAPVAAVGYKIEGDEASFDWSTLRQFIHDKDIHQDNIYICVTPQIQTTPVALCTPQNNVPPGTYIIEARPQGTDINVNFSVGVATFPLSSG